MISEDIFTSYAQYHEDIILAALLHNKKSGFYVDVGANHEEFHSVTKYFYKKGWTGINIEPIPRLYKEFNDKRKKDINLNLAISEKPGRLSFREYPKHDGLSTFDEHSKKQNEKLKLPFRDYEVKVERLATILMEHQARNIDFLKIDVEGYELSVLKSNDWKVYRPKIICIEANHKEGGWSSFFKKINYTLVIQDGLNEYYVADEHMAIFKNFSERATVLNHSAIRSHHEKAWKEDLNHIKKLNDVKEHQQAHIEYLERRHKEIMKDNKLLINQLKRNMKEKYRFKKQDYKSKK